MELTWSCYELDEYPGALWDDWDRIDQQKKYRNPMLSSCFVRHLTDAFGDDLYVSAATNQHQVLALFVLEKCGYGLWRIFKPSQLQVAAIIYADNLVVSVPGLLGSLPGYVLRLDCYALDPIWHSELIQKANERQEHAVNVKIQLTKYECFDGYWSARGKSLRKKTKRSFSRINDKGSGYSYQVLTGPADVASAVDRYGFIESKGWKSGEGTALHPANVQGQFYRNLMKEFADQDGALVVESFIDDQQVASRLCVKNDEMLIILKTTYREDYADFSPGKLNLYSLINFVYESLSVECIDFYTNARQDQLDWINDSRVMCNTSYYRSYFLFLAVSRTKAVKLLLGRFFAR